MDELNFSHNNDTSLISRETEANSINTSSSENKCQISVIDETKIIKAIVANLNDIIEENIFQKIIYFILRNYRIYLWEIIFYI